MKRTLVAATLLSSVALLATPAFPIDVTVGGEGGADVTIGIGDDGIAVGAGADANAGASANAAGASVGANAAAGVDASAAASGEIIIRSADPNVSGTVAAETVVDAGVYTLDDVRVGTVQSVTAVDGRTVIIVDLEEGYVNGVDRVAIVISAVVKTDAGVEVQTTDEDLKASIAGSLGAQAGAAAVAQ